jgi:hypothetical protein
VPYKPRRFKSRRQLGRYREPLHPRGCRCLLYHIISYPSLFTPQTQSIPSLPLPLIPPPHPLSSSLSSPLFTFSHPLPAPLPLLTPFTFLSLQVSTISDESSEERTVASGAASVSAALKQLQEDVAVLRRVSRIPDSGGVYAKSLLKLKSGMI